MPSVNRRWIAYGELLCFVGPFPFFWMSLSDSFVIAEVPLQIFLPYYRFYIWLIYSNNQSLWILVVWDLLCWNHSWSHFWKHFSNHFWSYFWSYFRNHFWSHLDEYFIWNKFPCCYFYGLVLIHCFSMPLYRKNIL